MKLRHKIALLAALAVILAFTDWEGKVTVKPKS